MLDGIYDLVHDAITSFRALPGLDRTALATLARVVGGTPKRPPEEVLKEASTQVPSIRSWLASASSSLTAGLLVALIVALVTALLAPKSKKTPDTDRLASDIVERLTKQLPRSSAGQPRKRTPIVSTPRTGRNERCPCGSGKKFKKCCGR